MSAILADSTPLNGRVGEGDYNWLLLTPETAHAFDTSIEILIKEPGSVVTDVNQDGTAEAKAVYDRACGAARGASDIGFILALTLAFWIGGLFPYKYAAMSVIGVVVMLAVRGYYEQRIRLAQDYYHRVANLGKYAPSAP